MVSFPEAARERDLRRYYQPWLDAQNIVRSADGRGKPLTYEGYQPQNCRDKTLTAFAQLATLRLNVRRCMVSLIDSSRQYILAEATKTLSLYSNEADRPEDEIWLGNTIIARYDAVCHYTLGSTYIAKEENGDTYRTECLVIPDCRQDPRLANRDYVQGEPGVRFYAGVPIITKAGYHIGVYAVSDEKPREEGLSAADVRFMEDMAATIMEHLELAKDSDDRTKGERMVRGLTEFIERSSLHERRSKSGNGPRTMERQTENARLDAAVEDVSDGAITPQIKQAPRRREGDGEPEMFRIFQRAARIIRQSTHADGVVFFDTSATAIGAMYESSTPLGSSDEDPNSSTTDFLTADSATSMSRRRKNRGKKNDASGDEENGIDLVSGLPTEMESRSCPVAGLSLRSCETTLSEDFSFTEAGMERYIMRYPCGKFFNFDEDGVGVNSSDERSEKSETEASDNRTTSGKASQRIRRKRERFVPTELLKVLPNVRSLIFLPLWDPSSERWVAGCFIWTTAVGRLTAPENELPYLKAFGDSITSELARWNALKSDRAKTTFIASISHELRSPLHGILGSVEFLQDTVTSAHQKSLVSSIETCGRTLLDTIDHVLDYAKINKLQNARSRGKRRGEGRAKRLPEDNSILGVTTDFNLAQLVEEVCDTVCAGHTFRKTHTFPNGAFHDQGGHSRTNSSGEKMITDDVCTTVDDGQRKVSVTLNVAPFVDWIVRSQPGALRRIVMNLLGNALKYTDSGYIVVSLLHESSTSHSVMFKLCIEDSGRGMSVEYQHTRLFAPFSQENPFSNGTGLGLSIVRQIVDSLKGEIEVTSTLHIGTKVTVSLRLPGGTSENARTSQGLLQAPEALKQKSASIVFPSDSLGGGGQKVRESMQQACYGFSMKTYEEFDLSVSQPDFLLTEPLSLGKILAKQATPDPHALPLAVICICTDLGEKTALGARISAQCSALGWILEAAAQPCGPRKLARILLDCQNDVSREASKRPLSRSNTSHPSDRQVSPLRYEALAHRSMTHAVAGTITAATSTVSGDPSLASAALSAVSAEPSPEPSPAPQVVEPSLPPPSESQTHSQFAEKKQQKESAVSSPVSPGCATPRVLLVDDNAINLKLLVVFARRQNLSYSEATNGLEAVEEFRSKAKALLSSTSSTSTTSTSPRTTPTAVSSSTSALEFSSDPTSTPTTPDGSGDPSRPSTSFRPFDFVLMDLSMPVMDGLEATRQIRQFETENGLPRATIIALTGLASAQDQRGALDAGVDMYLVKPVKFADIKRLFGTK
ncbi:hypothetical protein DL763_008337 [Monosporascus cannonballus]|nr:hypothetical protein DL763_008337 [Monosporascus cannonballus]